MPNEQDWKAQARELAARYGWSSTVLIEALREARAAGEAAGLARAFRIVDDEDEGPHGQDYQLGDVEDFRKRCLARLREAARSAPSRGPRAGSQTEEKEG